MTVLRFGIRLLASVLLLVCVACCGEDVPEICIDPSKVDPDAACIEIFSPVCGCDGISYDNSCFAEISGVTSWIEGICED